MAKILRIIDKSVQRLRIRKLNSNKKAKVHIANTVRLDKQTKVLAYANTHIRVGNNVYLRSNPNGYHTGMPFPTTLLADKPDALIYIGANCRLNGVYVHSQKAIQIGDNCVIAAGVNIIDSNGHQVNSSNRTIGRDDPQPIVIGNNVWIGLNAIILKGSVIGDNSVVTAGSVVKGVFPDNALIQGNPAQNVAKLHIE